MSVVVDTSALLALLLGEADAHRVADVLASAGSPAVAAPTLVEAMIVAETRLGPQGALNLQRVLVEAEIVTWPFDGADAALAIEAWRQYGKGRHPAGLNLGDCYAYALAIRLGWPLLFVGDDFSRTDVERA